MSIFNFVERTTFAKQDSSLLSKYRPTRLADVLCHELNVLCINQWFRQYGTERPYLMISGPSGSGKSLIADLALREHGFDRHLVLCCASLKSKKDVLNELSDIGAPGTAVIVDNLDHVDASTLSCIKEQADAFKKVPFIFLCEKHTYGKPIDIVKFCEVITLKRPPKSRLIPWVEEITKKESIAIDTAKLVDQCKGDVRQILLSLEMNCGGKQPVQKLFFSQKDANHDAIEISEHLLCNGAPMNVHNCIRLVHADINIITSMVSENYLDVASNDDIDAVADAADSVSMAEVVENKIFGNQQWELWDTFATLGAVYPASRVRCQNTHSIRFTRVWSRISNMYLRRGIVQDLRTNLRKTDVLTVDVDYLYGLSRLLASNLLLPDSITNLVTMCGHCVPYETVLFLMRLTMGDALKQTLINKIRKEYEARGFKELGKKALK